MWLKRSVYVTNTLCIRPTRYEYVQNFLKKHQNFSVRQRFTYIFIRCHCWLNRQGVTAPLEITKDAAHKSLECRFWSRHSHGISGMPYSTEGCGYTAVHHGLVRSWNLVEGIREVGRNDIPYFHPNNPPYCIPCTWEKSVLRKFQAHITRTQV